MIGQNLNNLSTMNSPLVSIVVPCYNVERFLPRTIDILLNQDYKQFEVYLIDDASTDNTKQICENICGRDARFTLFSTNHVGPAKARNVVLNRLCGKYVWFLDADDIPSLCFLSKMVLKAELTNADVTFCNYTISSSDEFVEGGVMHDADDVTKEEFLSSAFSLNRETGRCANGGFLWNKLIKRNTMVELSIPDLKASEDEAFLFLLSRKLNNISFVGQPLYQYRIREGQITSKSRFVTEFINTRYLITKEAKDFLERKIANAAFFQALLISVSATLRRSDFDEDTILFLKKHLSKMANLMTVVHDDIIDPKYRKYKKIILLHKVPMVAFRLYYLLQIPRVARFVREKVKNHE